MFLMAGNASFLVLGIGISAISLALLGIAKARQNLLLQKRILEGQKLEIAFKQKALDKHTLTAETDPSGIILDVNQKFLDAFKYRRADLIGRPFRELYFDDDRPISDEIRTATPSGRIWTGETRLIRGDGSVAITQTTVVPLLDTQGRHVKNLSLRVDATRYRAQKNAKTITSAFDDMLDAVVMHDPTTAKILYMNRFALANHGWTADQAMTKTLWDTRYIPNRDDMAGMCEKIQENSKSTVLLENKDLDRAYEASSYLVGVEGGDRRVLTIFRDMTEAVATERERNRLVSVITHELRTPLTSIKGSLRLLDAGTMGPMSTEAKSLVSIALRNSDRMLDLIQDILGAEREGQTANSEGFGVVNLSDLLETEIVANHGYGAQLGVDFANTGTGQDLWVKGNRAYIEQILSNLMSNAAKFSPKGSVVEISVSQEESMAVLHARDFGDGIPEELQPRLFERFTQGKQVCRQGVHSSGLGLSIVKTLVEKLGGSIDYDTAPGKGTCFHVGLPLASPNQTHLEGNSATSWSQTSACG